MFRRVSVPTPFQIGSVNAYLAGRTVVDPGPESEESWTRLREALDDSDRQPSDLEQVLITHPHPDHFGLAARLQNAGATVVASPAAAEIMADFPGRLEYEQSFFGEFFQRCGMSESTVDTVTELPQAFINYAPSVEADRTVSEGTELTVDGETLSVLEVRGHAVGEIVFEFDGPDGTEAVVGDNVLPHITPNPFLLPPPEQDAERPRVLPAYNDSLARLRKRNYDRMYPGHRELIDHPTGRIGAILDAHRERTETVAALVDGPTTPLAIMEGLFGDLPVTEYFSGMSEAVGHLDVLEAADRVRPRDDGDQLVYESIE